MISEFMCPCPDLCGKALESCECGDAAGYIKELADLQSAGLPAQAIQDKFVEKYGPTVLASPPAEGFGLAAYVLPPAALVLGIVVAVAVVRKWKRPDPPAVSITSEDLKRAEERLNRWK